PYAGSIEWEDNAKKATTVGLLLGFVPNETDGWTYTLNNIERSYENALTYGESRPVGANAETDIYSVDPDQIPIGIQDFIGAQYLEMVKVLGVRTAELHRSLASLTGNKALEPEAFSLLYQKSLHQAIRGMVMKTLGELETAGARLDDTVSAGAPGPVSDAIARVVARKNEILARIRSVSSRKIAGLKTRTHGDYHLGQVLHNGKDFIVIDFEGEPARPISERRLKQSPLRDVAGMVRSFHYAAHGAVFLRGVRHGADYENLKNWADLWFTYTAGTYLQVYRSAMRDGHIVPADDSDFVVLLETFLLEKAVYEIGYELNNRPDWIMIPIHGIEAILDQKE
ncbi:MAG: alpha-amylase, partial [Spirochaetaceae bacterium]